METIKEIEVDFFELQAQKKLYDFCKSKDCDRCVTLSFGFGSPVQECKVNWSCIGAQSVEDTLQFCECLSYAVSLANEYNAKYAGKKKIYND